MLDTDALEVLIKKEIKENVQAQVQQIVGQTEWMDALEQQITKYTQDRILGKFKNIGDIPDLVAVVKTCVNELFSKGTIPGVGEYVNQNLINQTINVAVNNLVDKSIDHLVVDPVWIAKVENLIVQNYTQKLTRHLSSIDINKLVSDQLDTTLDLWQAKLKENFKTRGITDIANEIQLTVMDGAVVASEGLAGQSLLIEKDAEVRGSLSVNNLILRGSVNTDNRAWNELADTIADRASKKATAEWQKKLVDDVLDVAKTQGINFDNILLGGEPLVADNKLNASVKETSIETTGTLRDLSTKGVVNLSNTVTVKSGRLGVNTRDPEMALAVWDEEVSVIAGKVRKDQAFIGTGRRQSLTIGTNRAANIEIDVDGLVTVKQFRIDRWRIGHGAEVPGYSGTRGDFILNSDPKPESPFAWVCLGGFRWQALRSAE